MRILQVINELSYRGGAQTFCINLSNELIKLGHEVLLVTLHPSIDSSFNEEFNGKILTCNKTKKFSFKANKAFKKIVQEFNPDVIHFHLSILPTYHFAFGIKRRNWILINTIHSVPGSTTNKIEAFLRKKYLKKNMITLVAITKGLAEITSKMYHVKPYYVNNGFPLEKYQPIKEEKMYDLIIVARHDENKNHILLFNAVKALKEKGINLKVLCVGGGSLLDFNREYAKRNKIDDLIKIIGPSNEVNKYLNQSKVFILTSKREGNPISILEAMSCGLPIIASSVGGVPDIVKNNVNGLLFEPDNVDDLINKIEIMFLNNELMINISSNNLKIVKEYSIEKCANEYLKLYDKIKFQN